MIKPEAPTVDDGFKLLAKSTELSLGEYTSITQSQADIELYLTRQLSTFSTVLYGAFSRKTIVSPLSGSIVNMLVVFRGSDVKNAHPSRVFSKLSDNLIKQYSDACIVEGQNALMLPMKQFIYKIQPAYQISDHNYMLPSEKFNEWVRYDVSSYNQIFVKENVRHKGKLIEIVRMMKTWNRVSGNLFNGYYLELLVTAVLASHEITSYAEAIRYVFKIAVAEVVFQKQDPASMEFQIEGLNDIDDLITAMLLLKKSYKLADEAILLEQDNNTEKALENWNKLFPGVFPTQVDMLVARTRSTGIKGADALRMMINQR